RIYAFLGGRPQPPEEIGNAACAGGDTLAEQALALWLGCFGAFAGDLSLHWLARGGVYLAGGIAARLLPGQSTAVPPPPAPPPAPEPKPVVGGVVQEPVLLERVQPVYPPLARQARIAGVVRVEALVGADGRVLRATAVSGPPLLRQSAVEAVQRWRYRPATLNGKPVEVTTQVDISFTLNR
ncbi:MAG TPA: TonB family protein, partial [Bryobacteraceae bacterium]|nr:TonB family protein [Bryobacteraceae bacterium]